MRLPRKPSLPKPGWRRAAVLNTITVASFGILLLGVLGSSVVKAGGLSKVWIFFEGNCDRSSTVNLFLHLVLNIVSTLIIASSNFFMQVLNAPTRMEIDHAHSKGRWLEIGVPSLGNIFHVSGYKTLAWVLFTLSSVPIHLLFNSAVFETDYQGSNWQLTMASEAFVKGAEYYGPGAGLVLSGAGYRNITTYWSYIQYGQGTPEGLAIPTGQKSPANRPDSTEGEEYTITYGLQDYDGPQSTFGSYLSTVAANASTWQNISAEACGQEYQACHGRRQYRDVIMILDVGQGEPEGYDGWVLNDIYNMSGISNVTGDYNSYTGYNSQNFSDIWGPNLPLTKQNSLWFSGFCANWGMIGANAPLSSAPACLNTCLGPLGLTSTKVMEVGASGGLKLDASIPRVSDSDWTISWVQNGDESPQQNLSRPYYLDDELANLKVRYCLAESKHPVCKVGLMNSLLGVTTLCVVIKTILCVVVASSLSNAPLVTPGDAIESFIVRPDPTSVDKATMSAQDRADGALAPKMVPGPRQWRRRWTHLASSIPKRAWFRTYLLCTAVLLIVLWLMSMALSSEPLTNVGGLFNHDSNIEQGGLLSGAFFSSGSMIIAVITANLPQIALSLSYFSYNALFTRLQAESEWNAYSVDYKPLRVTSRQGEQLSTYRLQLPYRYSIPLLTTSILLHWLVSNTIYISIAEGGYYSLEDATNSVTFVNGTSYGLSSDAYIGIGFSSGAILLVLCIAIVLLIIPIVLAWRKYKGVMVVAGANSMVISAACHVSLESIHSGNAHSRITASSSLVSPREAFEATGGSVSQDDMEMTNLLSPPVECQKVKGPDEHLGQAEYELVSEGNDTPEMQMRIRISQSRLRWGVVRMPAEFGERFFQDVGEEVLVGHLAFGIEDQNVVTPEEGRWYT